MNIDEKGENAHQDNFSWNNRMRSFSFAFRGLKTLWREEHNGRIHVFAAILAIIAGFYFDISQIEWCIIFCTITSVVAAECLNSALENLCDLASTQYHPLIEKAKDLGAAAVLMCALGAAAVGLIIFIPYVSDCWLS